MWVYIVAVIFLILALLKERVQLGCSPFNLFKDCNNFDAKPLQGLQGKSTDSTKSLVDSLRRCGGAHKQVVLWRQAYILAFAIIVMYIFVMYTRIPSEKELATGLIVGFLVIYASLNFYQFHLSNISEAITNKNLDILESRTNLRS